MLGHKLIIPVLIKPEPDKQLSLEEEVNNKLHKGLVGTDVGNAEEDEPLEQHSVLLSEVEVANDWLFEGFCNDFVLFNGCVPFPLLLDE